LVDDQELIVEVVVLINKDPYPGPQIRIIVVYYESIKRKLKTKYIWGVGVMKDYNLKKK
jgi:hypothetical protein